MSPGDLIKHKRSNSTALVVGIAADRNPRGSERDREWVTVLFTGDRQVATVPYKIIKENWEIVDDKI